MKYLLSILLSAFLLFQYSASSYSQQPSPQMTPAQTIPPPPLPSPTATKTSAQPTPKASVQERCYPLLVDSTFERGNGWSTPTTPVSAAYSAEKPYAGNYGLKLGILPNSPNRYSYSEAYQDVTLPADSQKLILKGWLWRGANNLADSNLGDNNLGDNNLGDNQLEEEDKQYLLLEHRREKAVEEVEDFEDFTVFNDLHDSKGWESFEVDITPYKGETVRLILGTYNDGENGSAYMFVDEVWLLNCKQEK